MRILHVIDGMDPKMGGVCQAVRTMAKGLKALGVENEVVCLDAPETDYIIEDPFFVHKLGPRKTPWSYSPLVVPWLLENLQYFDSVIVHGLWLYISYATSKAVRLIGAQQNLNYSVPKLFVMPHGMLDPYFQKASNRKIKALRNKAYWKFIESKVINNADGLFFTCEEERILAKEPFKPYMPKKQLVVGLGVDAPPMYVPAMREAFLKSCPGVQNGNYLLFIGRVDEKKGVDILINAYKAIFDHKIQKNNELPVLRLVIAGPGLETPFGLQMKELVSKTPELDKYIIFPGMLSGNAKWGAFYGCEAFILASHQENFGIAVVEALACSKIVLISNQVNIWREIEKYGAGIVMEDSEEGTRNLLISWKNKPTNELEMMQRKANTCFADCFATAPAALKLLAALK